MTFKQAIIYILLFIAVILSCWLMYWYVLKQTSVTITKPTTPDAFAKQVVAIRMDENGNILNELFTPYLIHSPVNNTTTFVTPHLVFQTPSKEPWHVYADHGQMQQGDQTIVLWGNVKAIQAAGPNNPATALTTTAATLYPKLKQASTDQPVTLVQPGIIVKSVGAHVDLKQNTVDLLSQVSGEYQSNVAK